MCSGGVCQANTSRVPECHTNADCSGGAECVNAYCRNRCYTTADCASCGAASVCNLGYCETAQEVSPMCTMQSQCSTGQNCVNASCM